jgi:inner membrane protein
VLLALLSHLFLDWTNNYGIRPLFPFDRHWFAGSFVFIFDPYIFVVLLAAALAPWLFRLVSAEVGAKREVFVSRGWSWVALVLVAAMWGTRAVAHHRAVEMAMTQSYEQQQSAPPVGDAAPVSLPPVVLPARKVLVSPDPLSFWRWYSVTDYGPVYQLATLDLFTGLSEPSQFSVPKMQPTSEWLAAERSRVGQVYLDWSSMPLVRVDRDQADPSGERVVTFQDGRFMGDSLLLSLAGRSPLTATVTLDRENRVVEQTMDGKIQK